MDDASGPGPKTRMPEEKPSLFERRMLLAVYQQNWENARHIKNERLSFTNIYCIVAAGMLSLFHTVEGKRLLEISMLLFLVLFSLIGLLTSLTTLLMAESVPAAGPASPSRASGTSARRACADSARHAATLAAPAARAAPSTTAARASR